MHTNPLRRLLLCALVATAPAGLAAQIPGVGDLLSRTPGLRRILEAEPALTTSLEMARESVAVADLFEPSQAVPMTSAPRTADGGFLLARGAVYELRTESYCLMPGSRGPTRGDGYLDAPLRGPMSSVIQHILDRAAGRPEIAQTDIQVLLWSILARARLNDLPRNLQTVAARLLDRSELVKINGGALGLIPDAVKEAALARLPPAVARTVAAEASLRELVSRGAATYDEMEAIAVRNDLEEEPGTEIPRERWSFRDGLFVRYEPDGYQETVIRVYVPGPSATARVERDAQRRLSRITDDLGRTIEITYDASMPPRTFRNDPGVRAWAFNNVAYTRTVNGQRRRDSVNLSAWTLVGMPNGRGALVGLRPRFVILPAMFGAGRAVQDDPTELADDLRDRYDRASQYKDYYDRWKDARDRNQGGGPSADDVVDENHYKEGLDKAKNLDFQGEAEWLRDHNDSLGRMAARNHCYLSGACSDDDAGPKKFKPSDGAATPGSRSGQRLGQSGRAR